MSVLSRLNLPRRSVPTVAVEVPIAGRHIASGVTRYGPRCVIALALREALPGAESVNVDEITLSEGGRAVIKMRQRPEFILRLPVHIAELAYLFDHDQPVEPCTFTARVPVAAVRS